MAERPSLWQRLTQAVSAGRQTALRRMGLDRVQSVMVDLSKEEMARIGPGTADVKGIYFSDFVEGMNPNQIRRAREFRKTADTLVTDRNIPLSRISRFYGVEDGKVKVGSIGSFRDTTVVVPVRNRNYGPVSGISVTRERLRDRVKWTRPRDVFGFRRETRSLLGRLLDRAKDFGVEPVGRDPYETRMVVQKREFELIDRYREMNQQCVRKLDSVMTEARSKDLDSMKGLPSYDEYLVMSKECRALRDRADSLNELARRLYQVEGMIKNPARVLKVRPPRNELSFFNGKRRVSEETMTRSVSAKLLMADSTGRAVFINDLMRLSPRDLRRLNDMLSEHPLYPVLVDNGRYSHYQLEAGSYRDYIRQDLYRPDKDLFVIGSVEKSRGKGVGRRAGESEAENVAKDLERRKGNAKRYEQLTEKETKTVIKGVRIH